MIVTYTLGRDINVFLSYIRIYTSEWLEESSRNERLIVESVILECLLHAMTYDYMTDIEDVVVERLYKFMVSHFIPATMHDISCMVNEIIESEEYRKVRRDINKIVANTSRRHLGVAGVKLSSNMRRVTIELLRRK